MGEEQEDRLRADARRMPSGGKAAGARKRKQAAGAERAWLAAIVASSFDPIIGTDLNGTITSWNVAAERLYGYTAGEMVGRHISLIVPDNRMAEVNDIVERLHRGERVSPFETVRRRKDGAELVIEVTIFPIVGPDGADVGAASIQRDITARKRAEAALRERERELRLITNALPGVVARYDLAERYLFANATYASWFGIKAEDLIGRTLREVLGEAAYRVAAPFYARARQGEHVTFENEISRPGVPWRHIRVRVVPDFDEAGAVRGCYTLATDITERKQAEESRELLIHELSHRVKNMLAVVQAMFKQSQRLGPSPEAFEAAFIGRIGAMAAAHDLLTRSRWDGAALDDVAAQVLEPLRQQAGGIAIQGRGKVMLKPQAVATLAMVLHELATNGAKHGALAVPQGRVELTWTVEAAHAGPVLDLRWREAGGPPVTEPTRRGFGRHLIERAVGYELGGVAELSFAPGGLQCRIRIPLTPDVGSRSP